MEQQGQIVENCFAGSAEACILSPQPASAMIGMRLFVSGVMAWLITTGCTSQANELWIADGSTADRLVFGLGKTREGEPVDQFGVLRVYECGGSPVGEGAMWVLSQAQTGPAVQRVIYGETPSGYVSGQGPRALSPGCYQATATTGGIVEFHVLPDRTIREVEPVVRWDRDHESRGEGP